MKPLKRVSVDKIELRAAGDATFIAVRFESGSGAGLGSVLYQSDKRNYLAKCEDVVVGSYGSRLAAIKAVINRCGYGDAILP